MRSPLSTIGRLQQQGFKYKNLDHAYNRLMEWENWFRSSPKIRKPASPAPNQDAAGIDKLVWENTSKIMSEIVQLPMGGLKANIKVMADVAQKHMISPPIIATIIKIVDELEGDDGASSSSTGSAPLMPSPCRARIASDPAYEVFIEKTLDKVLTDLKKLPQTDAGAARAIPRIKGMQATVRSTSKGSNAPIR